MPVREFWVEHGPLAVKNAKAPLYLSYFTSSLESTIQAGSAAASAFDAGVLRLPT